MIRFEPRPFLSGVYDSTDSIGSARPIIFEARDRLGDMREGFTLAASKDRLESMVRERVNSHCAICPRRKLRTEDMVHTFETRTRTYCEAPCLIYSEVVTLYVNGCEQQKFLISYPAPYHFYKAIQSVYAAFNYENNLQREWRDLLGERVAMFKGDRWTASAAEIYEHYRGRYETDPELLVRVSNGPRDESEAAVWSMKNLLEDQRLQDELDELEESVELEALQGGVPLMGTFA